ncbi:brahma associated protein 170kD isoform X3 [Arctopsyche grandis]|uniref:brahma associated protein 170kD isoform X3 n=1 Tax=Arctopsyche grandis TaxID=121162 RepID=UPI00406DA0CA
MTKFHIRTNSSSYQRERVAFLKELGHFHDTRGSAIRHAPIVNGKEIDLYLLYMLVTHHGGWIKVNGQGLWDIMLKQLGLPSSCVNGGVAIRQVYLRYLERWERTKGAGAAGGAGDMDGAINEVDDDRPRRSGWGTPRARNTVALTYNHTQHNVPDHIRECNGLSPLQRLGGAMERMALSLLSPLPNEQDFALNVCTILAADSANKLPVNSLPHIIDFLLGHVAVYNHPSLRDVIGNSYKEARNINMEWYWLEHSRPSGILELLDEERFPIQGLAMQAIVSQLNLKSCLTDDGTMMLPDDKELPVFEGITTAMLADEDGIFAGRCPGGARDLISRRVSQVVTIMRNISFHEENVPLLAKHQTFLRFIILCVNCSMSSTRQAGLDSLGNVASELTIRDPATCLLSRHLLATLTASLHSDDRARALSALEVLNKLAQNEANEDVLLRCLEQKVYEQVCSYLTLHDIMLLVVTLECMYALTTLGERSCDYIVKIHGVIDTLVSLITVEAQSYGPKACILMRVVETVSGTNAPNSNISSNAPPQLQTLQSSQPVSTLTPPPLVSAQTVNIQQAVPLLQVATLRPDATIQLTVNAQSPPQLQANNISVQQQHAHQQVIQENEQFALQWLRSTWEPCTPNIRLDANELYKQYLACCSKVGRKGVISPLHFPRCVRSVFGGVVGPNPIKAPNGESLQFYMGIRQRSAAQVKLITPVQSNIKSGPASPILKAQLSKAEQNRLPGSTCQVLGEAPLITTISSPVMQITPSLSASTSSAVSTTPPPSQQSSNTTLIKHLLAHKVSVAPPQHAGAADRMDRMQPQVTQRQNQQKMLGQSIAPLNSTNSPSITSPISMDIDAEALISCSTITSSGVTSTSPMQLANVKVTTSVPPGLIQDASGRILDTKDENFIKKSNPMLTNLVEKKSPPLIGISPSGPIRSNSHDESHDEPTSKKARIEESVSSTAANLYAALAASALEDEEDLLVSSSDANANANATAAATPSAVPAVTQNVIPPLASVQQEMQQSVDQVKPLPVNDVQDPEVRQVIVPAMQSQAGQIILHGNPGKGVVSSVSVPNTQFVSHPPQMQLIAQNNQQGIGFPGGVMPTKTIIILQGGNSGTPITLTVNNSGGLDENTLNNLITQATDALNQQQSLSLSHQTNNSVMQSSTGVIQTTQGMIQPNQTIIQTNAQNMLNQSNIIKQQIVQGQTQLVPSQQPVITQQPQPQIISGGQVITNQTNPQMITVQGNQAQQFGQVIGGNPQIIVGNQQLISGNQLVVGNQQIMVGNQSVIGGTHQMISNNQQYVSVPGTQQRIIVDQQGNRQILPANQNIVIANQQQTVNQEKKIVMGSPPHSQGNVTPQKILIGTSQQFSSIPGYQQVTVEGQQNNVTQSIVTRSQQKTETVQPIVKLPPVSPHKIPDEPWVCQWRGCDTVFESAAAVYSHACNVHCTRVESPCLWAHCDQLPRRRFSLMTHLQDRHCSADALKASLVQRRKGIIPSVSTPAPQPTSSVIERIDSPGSDSPNSSSHPGYAPNAALHAIKRHAVDFLNPRELMDDNEGPVTKSIRLTAALILRNIVIYSHIGRRLLRGYEPHLAGIALSSVEASRTVAQVLYDMNCI